MSTRPEFVKFGEVRIKLSNIKNYGVNVENKFYEKVYKRQEVKEYDNALLQFLGGKISYRYTYYKDEEISSSRYDDIKKGVILPGKVFLLKGQEYLRLKSEILGNRILYRNETYKNVHTDNCQYASVDGVYETNKIAEQDDVFLKEISYMYVTTYQNDNFKFMQDLEDWDVKKKCAELDKYLCI